MCVRLSHFIAYSQVQNQEIVHLDAIETDNHITDIRALHADGTLLVFFLHTMRDEMFDETIP